MEENNRVTRGTKKPTAGWVFTTTFIAYQKALVRGNLCKVEGEASHLFGNIF